MKRLLFAFSVVAFGCGLTQDFGQEGNGADRDSGADGGHDPSLPNGDPNAGGARWTWFNPMPTGVHLRAIWGTSDADVWMAGEDGVVARWDGNETKLMRQGVRDEVIWGIWGSSSRDVWVAGGRDGRVLHWDGAEWWPAYSLEGKVMALWGTAENDIWAIGKDVNYQPNAWHYDGRRWSSSRPCCGRHEIRDVWGSRSDDVWVVGDEGSIFHFDGTVWAPARVSAPGVADPFAAERAYFGVWGSAPNDVWAVAGRARTPGETGEIAFSHWDGSAWRVVQVENSIAQEDDAWEERRGRRVWGSASNDVAVAAANPSELWRWDGVRWRETGVSSVGSIEALWSTTKHELMTVGYKGAFGSVSSSGTWTSRTPAIRHDLSMLSVASDGTAWTVGWENGANILMRSTPTGWRELASLPLQASAIQALAPDDIWVAGPMDGDSGVILRYGSTGEPGPVMHVPMRGISRLWVHNANDVWAIGPSSDHAVAHFDGRTWSKVAGVGKEDLLSVTGTAENDVWIAGSHVVFHWDGTSLREVLRSEDIKGESLWASSPTNVWVGGAPAMRWDGTTWSKVRGAEYGTQAIWGSGSDDVWVLNGYGSILRWDGTALSPAHSVSSELNAISGNGAENVWVVGTGGATLRYTNPSTGTR